MSTLEEVVGRLATIQDELLALPAGPSKRRFELLKEQDKLREMAAEFAEHRDEHRSDDELRAELDSLRTRQKSLVESRSGYVMGKGGDNAGPASGAWVGLSTDSKAASGAGRLSVRISQIEDELARRERETD